MKNNPEQVTITEYLLTVTRRFLWKNLITNVSLQLPLLYIYF
jgi:hypothetical protein